MHYNDAVFAVTGNRRLFVHSVLAALGAIQTIRVDSDPDSMFQGPFPSRAKAMEGLLQAYPSGLLRRAWGDTFGVAELDVLRRTCACRGCHIGVTLAKCG